MSKLVTSLGLCAATLRKDSKSRSNATEDPTKVSCPFCVQLMHPQACGQAAATKITGIPLKNARLAIRLVGASPRKILSEAQQRALAAGSRPFKSKAPLAKSPRQSLESSADSGVVVIGGEGARNVKRVKIKLSDKQGA